MPFLTLKSTVLSKRLCSSCGLCEVVCPENSLTMTSREPRLIAGRERLCGNCNLCSDVCPGQCPDVSKSEQVLFGRSRKPEERWLGIMSRSMMGRATDPDIYEYSSSGGCTTALLLAAQKELDLKYLVVAGRDPNRPWLASSRVCKSKDELVRATQQSTYQLFPHLRVIKDIRTKDPAARIGMVALPCQVQAVRKLQRMHGPLADYSRSQIAFLLEIACSSNTLPSATEKLITGVLQLSLHEVRDVRYRDGAYPGKFVVHLRDGGQRAIELWQSVDFFKKYKTHRCLSCGDWMSGLADASLCDGDPNIFMSSALPDERRISKHGRLMIRTALGSRVVDRAVADGSIEVMSGKVDRMNLGLERKRNRRAHYEHTGLPIPAPPIPGYVEDGEAISDEYLLQLSGKHSKDSDSLEQVAAESDRALINKP